MSRECEDSKTNSWTQLQLIPGPRHNQSGLVTGLLFFPGQGDRRSLLVTYAEAGWG